MSDYVKTKSDFDMEPCIDSTLICIWEWPNPMAEIEDKETGQVIQVKRPEDCKAIIESLTRLLAEYEG